MRHSARPALGQRETSFLLGRHLGRTLNTLALQDKALIEQLITIYHVAEVKQVPV